MLIWSAHNRVVFILAHHDIDQRAVLLGHHAVQRHGAGDPLILFDAAVIVRIGIGDIVSLIEGVLLDIDARGIDVRAEDVHAFLQRLYAQHEEHEALAHPVDIDTRARFKLSARTDDRVQILEAVRLGQLLAVSHALALCFAVVDEIAIGFGKGFHPAVVFGIRRPRILSFHGISSFRPALGRYSRLL